MSWETSGYNACWEGKCTTTETACARQIFCVITHNFPVLNYGSLDINHGSKRIFFTGKVLFKVNLLN
ncbi:hypothetical protein HOLleu_30854 [Holothuria leucospilota]|uniref:Uncharacterized protein n=1 Tax=Holothuria leucospilota TaxID=206669 RepID=A0A9Q1GXE1_HOLLE|nr:hypothetical protein HOLleu_30854 [Holothuria leucospilota]